MSDHPHHDPHHRRLAAELELIRAVHAVTIHELGNPLQSLLVSIELSRDDLRDNLRDTLRDPGAADPRTAARLDRALESVARLRSVLLGATAIRVAIRPDDPADPADPHGSPERESDRRWGEFLDEITGFVGERLAQLRSQLRRETAEIDAQPILGGSVRIATFALLFGVTEQLRRTRGRDWSVLVEGRALPGQTSLRVGVRGPGSVPVAITDGVARRVDDLLATDTTTELVRDGDELVLVCPAPGTGPG
jgi:hypothetical protein